MAEIIPEGVKGRRFQRIRQQNDPLRNFSEKNAAWTAAVLQLSLIAFLCQPDLRPAVLQGGNSQSATKTMTLKQKIVTFLANIF